MKNRKEDEKINHNSKVKTNSSSKNEDTFSNDSENDFFQKTRPRGGIKSKINNFQAGRNTISVPITKFSGISPNADFQSKLSFFNGGKPHTKFKHMPLPQDKVIKEETEKKENKIKKTFNKEEPNKKKNDNNDDIDSNININSLLNSKNNNSNNYNSNNKSNNNINNEYEGRKRYTFVKKNSVSYSSNQFHTLLSKETKESKNSSSSQKNILPEKKVEVKKKPFNKLNLNSLKDQWKFQKILLDYNILDFTSKLN